MRLIGLINFYDERPDWLAACVASLANCCDHIVACDGAYALFPQAKPHSGDVQAGTIVAIAQALNLGVTYHAPQRAWSGNEVEKRNHGLQLALRECEPEQDWILAVDADMVVRSVPSDLRTVLDETDAIVGTYWVEESFEGQAGRHPMRYLFRASDDLHIRNTHYGYRRGDTYLWETGGMPAVMTDLLVEHRGSERSPTRNQRGDEYDRRRETYGIETQNPQQIPV